MLAQFSLRGPPEAGKCEEMVMISDMERRLPSGRTVSTERRNEPRDPVERRARLFWNNGACMLLGMVRDLSESGARIRFCDICAVPDEFYVEIEGSDRVRRAKICWRSLTEIGVAFG
ncbi:PilZ domain-containing protein [Nitratireductor kimnyeongensis]|uniref:PilZ domain-containing protein n=1 Tax=Nitratireductor kimnyeongensis TaxID=430679 RepID=A0ABW0TA85_9HYPH|nr:PilZ domain-containing protein [Nitratireductor kimnyeongensis]QZZ35877.1 PilZ domain-containing protein [Nitratireductor kimnyeongensis]